MANEAQTEPRQAGLTLTDRELADRLGWFTQLRWAIGAGALLMLLVSWYVLGIRFRFADGRSAMSPAVEAILVVFLYNAAFAFVVHIVRARGGIRRQLIVRLALAQLVCDMLAICAVAHYTGGVENLFIMLVLVPLVIATELLPAKLTYATAAGAAAMINALAWLEQQGVLSHVEVHWPGKVAGQWPALYADAAYVTQVTVVLTITIFVMVFVASTISGRLRRREAELEQACRRLAEVDKAKSFFMRKAGHELRAPLAAISSILEAIAHTSKALEDTHRRLIDRTQYRTKAMMDLLDDLRRYSYLQGPEGVLKPVRLDLERIVSATVELFRLQAEQAGLKLTGSTQPVAIQGDEEMIREVVTNLVANAVQYTPAGGEISVKLAQRGEWASLTVSDTGIGISQAAAEGIFQEFYRSPEARRLLPEGTGLGLAITKRIVTMHGGMITFTSGEGKGTVFSVSLPVSGQKTSGQGQGIASWITSVRNGPLKPS